MVGRSDGLDSPLSPNGPHPRYYVETQEGVRRPGGPWSCATEATSHLLHDTDCVVDHTGREIDVE